MKKLIVTLALFLSAIGMYSQDIIELDSTQSMCISGKGPGQDGAINPYLDTDSIGIVENVGDKPFSIRIQKKDDIIRTLLVAPKETKEVKLLKGYVLYFDTDKPAIASVSFKKME